jgi:uncharacterized membrane protein YqjE
MAESDQGPPGLFTLVRRLATTGGGAVRNRVELLGLEWQEERLRIAELLVWGFVLVFCGMMAAMLLTAAILVLIPQKYRVAAMIVFALLYVGGAVAAWFGLKAVLRRAAFPETLNQLQKDRACLDSLK